MPQDEDGEDDTALFRRAMQDVRPLKGTRRAPTARHTVKSRARFARAERAAVLRESLGFDVPAVEEELQPGDELLFRRAGVSEQVLRRLRRGMYRVDAEIDLHGLTVVIAIAQLASFLREARMRGWHCVRIIHGKGLRSGARGPVLKNAVNAQLRRADAILAFASARPPAGGTGATLVLLARL